MATGNESNTTRSPATAVVAVQLISAERCTTQFQSRSEDSHYVYTACTPHHHELRSIVTMPVKLPMATARCSVVNLPLQSSPSIAHFLTASAS